MIRLPENSEPEHEKLDMVRGAPQREFSRAISVAEPPWKLLGGHLVSDQMTDIYRRGQPLRRQRKTVPAQAFARS